LQFGAVAADLWGWVVLFTLVGALPWAALLVRLADCQRRRWCSD
jgi:hypothetical protein